MPHKLSRQSRTSYSPLPPRKKAPNSFHSSQGDAECQIHCPSGQFADHTACSTCPAGTFSDAGSTSCTDCSPGTFSGSNGSGSCVNCPPGTTSLQVMQSVSREYPFEGFEVLMVDLFVGLFVVHYDLANLHRWPIRRWFGVRHLRCWDVQHPWRH